MFRRGIYPEIWILAGLVVISLLGFAGYYYYDRYVHADEKLVERETRHLEDMIMQNPQDAELRAAVGDYYLETGATGAAIQQANEVLKIRPDHQGALVLLGRAYAKQGDAAKAIASYERVVELNRDNAMAKADLGLERVYFELGRLYAERGQYSEAVQTLRSALDIDRGDADARYWLSIAYQKQNDHEAAIKELEESLRYDPAFGDAYLALVTSYAALGRNPEADYARAMASFGQGKYDEAAERLEMLSRQGSDPPRLNLGLGLVYEKLKRRDLAISALQKYVNAYPNDIAARQALGRLDREVPQQ